MDIYQISWRISKKKNFYFNKRNFNSRRTNSYRCSIVKAIYLVGKISGAHVNPVVSMSMFINNKMSGLDFGGYVVAQCLGALAAVYFAKMVKNNNK